MMESLKRLIFISRLGKSVATANREIEESFNPRVSRGNTIKILLVLAIFALAVMFGYLLFNILGFNLKQLRPTPAQAPIVSPARDIAPPSVGTVPPAMVAQPAAPVVTAPPQSASKAVNEPHELQTYKTLSDAQNHCKNDTVVWLNTRSGVFHLEGQKWYGKTVDGTYVCKQEAVKAGKKASRLQPEEETPSESP